MSNTRQNATGVCLEKTLQKVEKASNTLFKWCCNNYMVANADKCHLLTSTSEEVSVKIENEIIRNALRFLHALSILNPLHFLKFSF